jgi:predicted phosphodiesterase
VRYLIISDIHANLEALDKVVATGTAEGYDRVVILGDLVGYGANPNEVIDRVLALDPFVVIRGNHDKVAAAIDDSEAFNRVAAEAAHWTQQALKPEHQEYLRALPAGPLLVDDAFEICHGSPADEDMYIFDELDALRAVKMTRLPVCFFGHTHFQVAFALTDSGFDTMVPGPDGKTLMFDPAAKYLINPGSVGQPRDGDRRAAYAMFDTDRRQVLLRRVEYPIEAAAEKVIQVGLPPQLADRLLIGR